MKTRQHDVKQLVDEHHEFFYDRSFVDYDCITIRQFFYAKDFEEYQQAAVTTRTTTTALLST